MPVGGSIEYHGLKRQRAINNHLSVGINRSFPVERRYLRNEVLLEYSYPPNTGRVSRTIYLRDPSTYTSLYQGEIDYVHSLFITMQVNIGNNDLYSPIILNFAISGIHDNTLYNTTYYKAIADYDLCVFDGDIIIMKIVEIDTNRPVNTIKDFLNFNNIRIDFLAMFNNDNFSVDTKVGASFLDYYDYVADTI